MKSNTIIALATPPLTSALAMIRVSGDDAFVLTDQLFSKKISSITKRTTFVGDLIYKGELIDNVVLIAYPHPNSFTGEDVVEISSHGSMLIVNEIVSAYIALGARYAERGEFSSRGFYNGRMDLVEVESINDLINATTKEAKNLSLLSYKGRTSDLIKPLRDSLGELLAQVEVNIDFPEYEDIEEANESMIYEKIGELRKSIASLIEGGEKGKIIKYGVKVALVGQPNVGKSSILNALLKENKAIVTDIPGTTRDIVEGDLNLNGVSVHFLDTAGIREEADVVEAIGVERSKKAIEEADVVVLVVDSLRGFGEKEKEIVSLIGGKTLITCYNKADKVSKKEDGKLYVSALNNDVKPLEKALYDCLGLTKESFNNPSLSNIRELGLLRQIDSSLEQAALDCVNEAPIDLVSINLNSAYNCARELLGEETTTDLTDEIFSRFCVGK